MRQQTCYEFSLDWQRYPQKILSALQRQQGIKVAFNYKSNDERRKQMNKGDLVNEVAKVVSTKKEAQEAVNCVISSITKALKKGEDVTVTGFGTFRVVKRKARKGRNPRTGEEIKIKASKAPKFTPGKVLKQAVK
jgi:DNA-binding protein HU-beta